LVRLYKPHTEHNVSALHPATVAKAQYVFIEAGGPLALAAPHSIRLGTLTGCGKVALLSAALRPASG